MSKTREFEKQTKAFLQTIEDKALKVKMEKEISTRKAELKRFVVEKVPSSESKIQSRSAEIKPVIETVDAKIYNPLILIDFLLCFKLLL